MILIDPVYQAVQSLANKDQRSSVKPTEFNSFSLTAMADIIDDAHITIKNDKLGLVYGKVDKERLAYAKEILTYFYMPAVTIAKTGDFYPRPADIEQTEHLFYGDYRIEELESYNHLTLLRRLGKHLSPDNVDEDGDSSADSNVYYLPTSTGYTVYPSTLTDDILISYWRKWAAPKWTYDVVLNTAVYNGSKSDAQNFELPQRFVDDLIWRIAIMAGINIRDTEMLNPLLIGQKEEEKENLS